MRRAASGERDAQDTLIERFYPAVRSMVHQRLASDFRKRHRWMLAVFSTGDIVQDVFVGVIRHLETTDIEDEDALIRYLATLVRHRVMDTVRHYEAARRDNRRHAPQPDESRGVEAAAPDTPTPSVSASLLERARILATCMEAFDARDRAVLELRLTEEKAFPEIAEELGLASAKVARTAFVKAHAKLLLRLREAGLHADGTESD